MAITLPQARKLLTASELTVFDASRAQPIRLLTAARLRSKATRARALRDKYRDLYRRQTVSSRKAPLAQRSALGADNLRTRQKAELFTEVLRRVETELKRVEAAAKAYEKAKVQAAKEKEKAKLLAQKARLKARAEREKAAKAKAKARAAAKPKGAPARSAKAPARVPGTTQAVEPKAPLDVQAKAKRSNPLRTKAGNLAIHAHQRSAGRRVQAKRDAR